MTKSFDYDVIVVGAGPAGATAARILSQKGYGVLILDRKAFPRPKLCAGLITWKTLNVLFDVFGIDCEALKSKAIIHYQSRQYAIWNRYGEMVRGRLDFPFHMVDRQIYDQFWLDLAHQAGAEVRTGHGVVKIEPDNSSVITDSGECLRARVILGADGVLSRVRSSLLKTGRIRPNRIEGLAFAIQGFVSRQQFQGFADWPVIYFGFIPWGYAWSFPGPKKQIVGICGLQKKVGPHFRDYFEIFIKRLRIPVNKISKLRGHPLPYGNFLRQPGCRNVLLLGDAAGLVDPLLGEGIYYAHKSGQIAAAAVLKAHPDWDIALEYYARYLNQTLIRNLRHIRIYRNIIFSLLHWGNYRSMGFFIKRSQKAIEEAIQGRRSFDRLILP
ncbi:MAG: geranylgeranyl reductase family protein [Deltaproteobacteria bacterium]|nr:MAG: geranylgeranyl reductase family protein [Deltaproteobacteria bacterium]